MSASRTDQVPPVVDSFTAESQAWTASVPGPVDAAAEAARQRIGRISRQFERILATVADQHGLTAGDWEALSALARSASADGTLTPSRMGAVLGLTSGTISVRLDRLLAAGLIESVAGGGDGRRRPVRLTPAGRAAWGEATVARTTLEHELISDALDDDEIEQLNTLLSRLLARLEHTFGPAPRHDMTRGRSRGNVR